MRRFLTAIPFVTITSVTLVLAAISATEPEAFCAKQNNGGKPFLVSPKQSSNGAGNIRVVPDAKKVEKPRVETSKQSTGVGTVHDQRDELGHGPINRTAPVVPTRTGTAVMNWSGGSGLAQGTIHVSPDQRLANPKFVPQVAKQPATHPVTRPNHAGVKPADLYMHNPRGGNVADNRVNRTPPIVRRQPVSTAGLGQGGIPETPNQRLANPKFVPEASNRGRSEPAQK